MNCLKNTDSGDYYIVLKGNEKIDISNEVIVEKKVSSISLKEINCDFNFSELIGIKRLLIFDSDLSKCTTLNFHNFFNVVETLNLVDTSLPNNFDFAQFSKLNSLELTWKNAYKSLNLSDLKILKLKKLCSKVIPLINSESLEILEIIQGNINNLMGIDSFKKLKALTLYGTKKIMSEELIKLGNNQELEYLHIYGYDNQIDLNRILKFKNIKWIILENCINVKLDESTRIPKKIKGINIIGKTNLSKDLEKLLENRRDKKYGYY